MSVTAASAEIALAAKDKCREIFVFPNRTNGWAARDEPRTQGGGKWLGGNFRESVIIKTNKSPFVVIFHFPLSPFSANNKPLSPQGENGN